MKEKKFLQGHHELGMEQEKTSARRISRHAVDFSSQHLTKKND